MVSVVVVLKHETSTLRQSHIFLSIDFKFGVGDCAREVTSSAKVGLSPMSGRPIYTFQLTGYATESYEKNIFAV